MSSEELNRKVNDLSKDLIKRIEENDQREFRYKRKSFGELGSKFEEIMLEIKRKVEEKGYVIKNTPSNKNFNDDPNGDTDICIFQIMQETSEEDTENWYD